MRAGTMLKKPTMLYQNAGVYTPMLQSGHQFCIGNGWWSSAATSAVKHLGWARLPLSLPPVTTGRREEGSAFSVQWGEEENAGRRIMSASDSSATGLICNKVRCWCSPFCLITLHADSTSSFMSPPSVCSETSSLCFLSALPSPLTLVSAQVYSGSFTLPASPHISLLFLIFFGHTVLCTYSLSI